MSVQVEHADYNLSDEAARRTPFGPGSHPVQDTTTLALGRRLTQAHDAARRGLATEEQLKLLGDIDSAVRRAVATKQGIL